MCKEIPARSRSQDEDETPSQKSTREENSESRDDILYRIGKMSSLVNGESGTPSLDTVSKSYEDFHSLDNEVSFQRCIRIMLGGKRFWNIDIFCY